MWLQVKSGPEAGRQLRIDSVLLIGRDPGSDLMLPDGKVSRRHAMVSVDPDGRIVVQDLRTANGTYVDGHRIEGEVALTGSEQLRIGDTILQLTTAGGGGTTSIAPDPRSGQILGGRYRIEGLIAEGGMGAVYLAQHTRTGKLVALKVLSSQWFSNPRLRTRFLAEPLMAGRLEHPNIIPIFDADESDGELFIAMQYVRGADLATLVDERGPLPTDQVVAILAQVGAALDAAHHAGLVHRDVKPGNILVASGDGPEEPNRAYLCDFGVTKAIGESGLTQQGQAIGTVDYMAPEQVLGEAVDGRSDIYALGCVLYECLTGVVPFKRDSQESVMYAHVHSPPPSARSVRPDLPAGVDAIVAKAIAKAPKDRFGSCAEMMDALRNALTPRPVAAETRMGEAAAETRMGERPATVVAAPETVVAAGSTSPSALGVGAGPGERAAPEAPPSERSEERARSGGGPARNQEARRRRNRLIAVAAAVAVVAGAIGAFLVLSGGAGPPATPTGLTAAAQPLDVSLRWTQPAEGERAVQWKVFRDGALLGATRQTSFADNSVTPGQTYTYAVRAIGQDARTSAEAVRTVTAQIPSIGYARLTGTFSVHVKVIQSTGYSGAYTGTQFDEAWVFTPVCSSGPCDVNWVNNDQKAMTNSLLSRNGFTYTGTSDGDFGVSCGTGQSKVAVSSHLEITLQVAGGGVSGSAWVATKLTGTLSEVEPASGSCHASSATDQVTLTATS